jgi:hypothetical protein
VSELVESCRSHDYTDLVMVHEHRGEPDGLVVCHLPYGPTAYFGIFNTVLRHDIGDKKQVGVAPAGGRAVGWLAGGRSVVAEPWEWARRGAMHLACPPLPARHMLARPLSSCSAPQSPPCVHLCHSRPACLLCPAAGGHRV